VGILGQRKDKTGYFMLMREANFFEDLALLRSAKAIELSTISEWIGESVVTTWEVWQPAVEFLRAQPGLGRDEYRAWQKLATDVGAFRRARGV
jgi:hypothetical protein